jgi:hypothetical protein
VVLLEDAAVFLVGGRADAAHLAAGEHRLDQVRGVHHAAGGGAGADDGVDLVDEQDGARLLLQLGDHGLEALLEVAAILGAGDQRAEVERINRAVRQHLGHVALDDESRQPFGDRGLADAGLADVQRVVLAAPAQDLDRALHLELAADQRIDAAGPRLCVEVGGVLLQRARALAFALGFGRGLFALGPALAGLAEAVRDEIHDVEARDVLSPEQVDGVALLLAEDRHQHVDDADFLLAARLHMEHRALQHALEAERRLHLAVLADGELRRVVGDVLAQLGGQPFELRAAALERLAHARRIEQAEQQVLDRQELVPLRPRLAERLVQTVFKFARQHSRVLLVPTGTASGILERAHQRMLVLTRIGRHL